MVRLARLGLLMAACLGTVAAAAEDNWPRFRGPAAGGVAPDNAGLPTTWTTIDNVQWVADVGGWGWSSPIVWGDRVFLTTAVSDEKGATPSKGLYLGQGVREPAEGIHHWLVYCFDLSTGKELWSHEAHAGNPQVPRHPKSTYASETPTTDGKRLYVLFGDLGLFCYELDGKPLWSQRIEPKKTFFDYGAAASPVVHDGRVIVVYDNLENSWIAALDGETGKQLWRTPRDETHSWATPFVWTNEVRTEIVVPGKNRNRGYSLDGKVLWEFDGRMSNLVIPSPFAAHGLCYIASGYVGDAHRPTFAVRPGASGNITPEGDFQDSEFIAWYQGRSAPYNPSQIVYGDHLYTLYDRGFLTCHDAKTGKEVYGKRRFSPSGSFTASPFAYNGHLFFLSEDGLTYVVRAGPEFEIVQRNDLDELCLASPAVAGDKLLIRTASKLYCLTEGAKLDAAAAARLKPRRKASSSIDIWSAAAQGNRREITRLLAAGTSVNARQPSSGSTPLDVVSGDWSRQLEGIYRSIGDLVGIELDLVRIRRTRPKIAERLRKRAAEQAGEDVGGAATGRPSSGLWQALPDMEVPRWEAGSVVFENRLYVFGGYKMPTKACKRVDAFDPSDNRWRKLADLPSAITHMNMVLDGRSPGSTSTLRAKSEALLQCRPVLQYNLKGTRNRWTRQDDVTF